MSFITNYPLKCDACQILFEYIYKSLAIQNIAYRMGEYNETLGGQTPKVLVIQIKYDLDPAPLN